MRTVEMRTNEHTREPEQFQPIDVKKILKKSTFPRVGAEWPTCLLKEYISARRGRVADIFASQASVMKHQGTERKT